MNFISRILLRNLNFFKFDKPAANTIRNLSLSKAHYLHSNYFKALPKYSALCQVKRFINGKPNAVNKPNKTKNSLPAKLHKVNLQQIIQNAQNAPPGLLIATFQKLSFLYHENKDKPSFHREVNFLSRSKVFHEFCSVLEKELPKFQPSYLYSLLDLVHFNILPESSIMKKLFVLILDNIHYFPVFDLLDLYCHLQRDCFRNIPACKAILEGCENYFEKYLEDELSHQHNVKQMTYFISENSLPLKVRQLLTEKCLDLIKSEQYNLTVIPGFFLTAFNEPILSLYKAQLLDTFKLILKNHRLPKIQEMFSKLYKMIVTKNDSLYDEEICKMFTDNVAFVFTDKTFVRVLFSLCEIGYYDREAVEKTLDLLLTVDPNHFHPYFMLNLASIFVETSSHEMNNPHWVKIKSQLENYNARKSFYKSSEIFQWCESLTFLGCNTTSLLSEIFTRASEFTGKSENCRTLLRLHHLCKKYFPDSGLGLEEELAKSCLENSTYRKNFYDNLVVDKFFGGNDYVIENCHTPDCHFFPIVAVLGPDNKPIDLSSYKTNDLKQIFGKNVNVNIEDIKKPPGSKVIAFVEYPSSRPFKFRNAPITSGYLQLFLKPYEGLDYNIIPLPEKYFCLENNEKLQYLSSEINKITESSETKSMRNEV